MAKIANVQHERNSFFAQSHPLANERGLRRTHQAPGPGRTTRRLSVRYINDRLGRYNDRSIPPPYGGQGGTSAGMYVHAAHSSQMSGKR